MSLSKETIRLGVLSMDPHAAIAARYGPRVAKKLHGLFLSQPRADAPLNKVYIDNTQTDCYVYIVVHGRRYKVRPWLTLVVNDNTGLVLGFAFPRRPNLA